MNRRDMMPLFIVIAAMIVLNILNGDFSDFGSWVYRQLLMLPGIVIGLTVHEFAHGLVSDRCGDPTPRAQGRLTLNPAAHIDLIGFLCLFFAGFGWGQPVQIDPRYYKHRRMDEFLVSIAGVTMNFIVAVALAFVLRLIMHSGSAFFSTTTGDVILNMVQYGIFINLVLMIFNLIPVPPLDGWGILTQIFDLEKYRWYPIVYQNGFYILLALILFNVTSLILDPAINGIWSWMLNTIVI
ncbi:site-2 protease family protein [Hornefia butyriciproducens]|uniref:site-2 protease family protein n=1 Tax=Hornefia butyriciproducens TaxID=2652293 RepID=UPI002A753BA3|nr:site-2 protease family protein [Hornefia butyriciproducens]MCI7327968.1 site-2 protease family protein [Clostridiales bacterium]MCI7413415.1 site-2 protease family protein [Clostridiales bacterium]MDY2989984.1 site-2 protease family protein [Hornefia butyriciproducens]MDY5462424.1 site-2 protease family protein [Hornefia butyriciproducens]MDY6212255.1 site-2 protease family protein [Hornefia butyriciproducens]